MADRLFCHAPVASYVQVEIFIRSVGKTILNHLLRSSSDGHGRNAIIKEQDLLYIYINVYNVSVCSFYTIIKIMEYITFFYVQNKAMYIYLYDFILH